MRNFCDCIDRELVSNYTSSCFSGLFQSHVVERCIRCSKLHISRESVLRIKSDRLITPEMGMHR